MGTILGRALGKGRGWIFERDGWTVVVHIQGGCSEARI
jgi:hypothetical protein